MEGLKDYEIGDEMFLISNYPMNKCIQSNTG